MPIPFLLAGLGVAAGALGTFGHVEAKKTNEEAERTARRARRIYNESKESLENAQNKTKESLLTLGYSKKNALENSVPLFCDVYDRIKNIELKKSEGINEIAKIAIDQKEVLQLKEMSNIYSSSIEDGAVGAATGVIIALAANGSLATAASGLSLAGSVLAIGGGVSSAVSIAGTAMSSLLLGASMTPLAAVAAPVVFFTGISASSKADENLEKAEEMEAEAEAASEKMKIAETDCNAIFKQTNMFNDLLVELDEMFFKCTGLLSDVVDKKTRKSGEWTVDVKQLTKNEKELLAVTRALAGAVKIIIDTPILTEKGNLSKASETVFVEMKKKCQEMKEDVNKIGISSY